MGSGPMVIDYSIKKRLVMTTRIYGSLVYYSRSKVIFGGCLSVLVGRGKCIELFRFLLSRQVLLFFSQDPTSGFGKWWGEGGVGVETYKQGGQIFVARYMVASIWSQLGQAFNKGEGP